MSTDLPIARTTLPHRERSAPHPAAAIAAVAVGLAAAGLALLQSMTLALYAPEGVAEMLWLLAVAALCFAVLAIAAGAVALRGPRPRGSVALDGAPAAGQSAGSRALPAALLAVAVALVTLAAVLHPIVGSGSGTA